MEPQECERLLPVHPGEILLKEFMKPYGVTQDKLAKGIGVHPRHVSEIVRGKRAISPNLSMRLARYFCTSPKYWIDFQVYFDMEVEERKVGNSLDNEIAPLPAAVRHMVEMQETLVELVETGEVSSEPVDRCYYCGNAVTPGTVILEVRQQGMSRIVQSLPGDVCLHCGQGFLTARTGKEVKQMLTADP